MRGGSALVGHGACGSYVEVRPGVLEVMLEWPGGLKDSGNIDWCLAATFTVWPDAWELQ